MGKQFQTITERKAIVSALIENRNQSKLTRWADTKLPYEYSLSYTAGAKIGMAYYLTRIPKFEAPPNLEYDEQFLAKALENFDESCLVINTTAKNLLDHKKSSDNFLITRRTIYTQIS